MAKKNTKPITHPKQLPKRQQKKENTKTLFKKDWLRTLEDSPSNPLTRERLLNWMASTGFVEGFMRVRMHQLDHPYYEDYRQEVWLQICLIPEDKLVFLYRAGKGRFTNYIKMLIMNSIHSDSSILYKTIRADRRKEVYLDDTQWCEMIDNNTTEIDVPGMITGRENGKLTCDVEHQLITTELKLEDLPNDFE